MLEIYISPKIFKMNCVYLKFTFHLLFFYDLCVFEIYISPKKILWIMYEIFISSKIFQWTVCLKFIFPKDFL